MKRYLIVLLNMLSVHAAMGQQAIDVHCHNILPTFKELLDRHGAALEETFPLPDWDVASHLKFMEEAGIETSVLSMPAPQPWFGDAEESRRAVRQYNETCARLKADYPGKFLFCASLPLPDVDAAIKEAVYVLDTLGADGIKLATNSRGQYVGDAALDTLMQVPNARTGAFLKEVIEPQLRQGKDILIVGHGAMNASIVCQIKDIPVKDFWSVKMKNAELVRLL